MVVAKSWMIAWHYIALSCGIFYNLIIYQWLALNYCRRPGVESHLPAVGKLLAISKRGGALVAEM
jgi:hypothetical protein